MAALLVKVGALLVKQLAKPLANRFETWVLSHDVSRARVVKAAQVLHKWEVYITRGAEGKNGVAFVGAMTEQKSLELASKLASEGFIFTVGVLIVAAEYARQRRKDILKKASEEADRERILEQARMERERLSQENSQQQDIIQQLVLRLDRLETVMQYMEASAEPEKVKPPRLAWGGFFGPRGLV